MKKFYFPKRRYIPVVLPATITKAMRITAFLLFVCAMNVHARTYSQDRLTLNLKDVKLSQVFAVIQQKTDYQFLYNTEDVQNAPEVSISVKKATVPEILRDCFKNYPLTYSIDNKTVVVKKFAGNASGQYKLNRAGSIDDPNSADIISSDHLSRPDRIQMVEFIVRGKVADENGNALAGVSVTLKGSTGIGTTTDRNGDYSISIPKATGVLEFSFIGFLTKSVEVNGNNVIDVVLSPTVSTLEQVVVVGYGTQKRKDLTGAVSSVSVEQFENVPSTNLSDAIAGRLSGLDITSGGMGAGATSQLLMRGQRSFTASNDPLIILDGVPYYGSFDDIDPRNVKSIDVLKDAATTAIYGSQGANGVIIISTIRGHEGKAKISLNGYVGRIYRYGDIPLMNAQQYAEKAREGYRAVGGYPVGISPKYDSIIFDPIELPTIESGSKGINFQDVVFKNGSQQNYQLGVQGGSKSVSYNVSGIYFRQTGIVPYDDFKRLSIRANLDFKFNNNVTGGLSLSNGYSENSERTINKTAQNFPGLTQTAITGQGGFLTQVYQADPAGQMYDPDGTPRLRLSSDGLVLNPMTDFVFDSYRFIAKGWRNIGNAYVQIKVLPKLTYKLNLGTTLNTTKSGESAGFLSILTNMGNPIANIDNAFSNFKLYESILTYDNTFGKGDVHHITATFVQGFQSFRSEENYEAVEDYPYEPARFYNLGSANLITAVSSDLSKWTQSSLVGRIFYGFKSKYLVTLSVRGDGASQFAPGHKWGYFPSAALAWRMSQEKFLENVGWIGDLKLRLSYGVSGNKAIQPYQTQGKLDRSSYVFGGKSGFGYTPLTFANKNLTWESTKVLNLGIDFGILNNRISGSLDLYDTKTYDLLLFRKLPIITGFDQVLENVGKTDNKGWELSLQSVNINNSDFKWRSTLSAYSNKTKIVSLFNGTEDDIGSGWFIGHPITVFYNYKKIGIWQTHEKDDAAIYGENPGQIKVLDLNNDKKINGDDRMILGDPEPKVVLSLFNQFNYKNWSLTFLAYARLGGMLNAPGLAPFAKKRYNGIYVDYWTENNPTNGYPQPNQLYEGPGLYGETLGYRNASYVTLKDITVGYSLPKAWLSKVHISTINLFVSGKNLWYWTKSELRKFNMRPDWTSGNALTYPALRTIVLGLNVDF